MILVACWWFCIYDLEVWLYQRQTTTQRLLITCSVSPVFLQQMPLAHTKKHSKTLVVTASSIWKFPFELVRRWVSQRWWWPWAQGNSNWWWLVCRRFHRFSRSFQGNIFCEFDKQNVGAIEVLLVFFLLCPVCIKSFFYLRTWIYIFIYIYIHFHGNIHIYIYTCYI